MISKVIFVEHVSPITSVSTPDIRHSSRRIYLQEVRLVQYICQQHFIVKFSYNPSFIYIRSQAKFSIVNCVNIHKLLSAYILCEFSPLLKVEIYRRSIVAIKYLRQCIKFTQSVFRIQRIIDRKKRSQKLDKFYIFNWKKEEIQKFIKVGFIPG